MEDDLSLLTQFSNKRKIQAKKWFVERYWFYKKRIGEMDRDRISVQYLIKHIDVEKEFPEDSILYRVVNTHAIRKVMEEMDNKKWKKQVLKDSYGQFVDMQCYRFETILI